jgi:hypothetical protein
LAFFIVYSNIDNFLDFEDGQKVGKDMLKVSSCESLIYRKRNLEAFEKQIFLLVFN